MLALLQRYLRSTSATRTSALLDELCELLSRPVDGSDASLFSSALLDAVTTRGSRARALSAIIIATELSPIIFASLCSGGATVFAQLAVGAGAFSTATAAQRDLAAALLSRWSVRTALSDAPRIGALETAVAYVETRGAARSALSDEDIPHAALIRAARESAAGFEPVGAGGERRKRSREAESPVPPVPDVRSIILACSVKAEAAETLLNLLNAGGGGAAAGRAASVAAPATAAAAPVLVDEDGEGFIWGDSDDEDDEWVDATDAALSAGAPGALDFAPAAADGVDGDVRESLRNALLEIHRSLAVLSSLDAQLRTAATIPSVAKQIDLVSFTRGRMDAAVSLAASLGVVAPPIRSATAQTSVMSAAVLGPAPAAVSLDEALAGALAKRAVKKRGAKE